MTEEDASKTLYDIFELTGRNWEDYGPPSETDIHAALLAMHGHLQTIEGSVAMELPRSSIKLDRDEDGRYNIYFRVGSLEVDDAVPTD